MIQRVIGSCFLIALAACGSAPSGDVVTTADSTDATPSGFTNVDITSADGTVLKALAIAPLSAGLHPAIAFPSSWGLFDAEYIAQARMLAAAGYVVVSYTPRGFWNSGGEIDTTGPNDVADARAVIDWMLANTSTDPARIGMAGVSLGAGISLTAAAHDSRIRAVAALSGWSDLIASLFGDQTRRQQTVDLLVGVAHLVGKPSPDFNATISDFYAARNIPQLKAWGAVRSVGSYLPALNASKPAILIANGYSDSIFPPNQLVELFGAYEGPKRLEFRPGDHAIPEATGLVGLQNGAWDSLRAWMDANLADGAPVASGIQLASETGGAPELYTDWSEVGPRSAHFDLGWTKHMGLDFDTLANGGVALVSSALDQLTGIPPILEIDLVDPLHGVWWNGPTGGAALRGIPKVHLALTPNRTNGTVVAYLYDVDALGIGKLITEAPSSWMDVSPGQPIAVDLNLPLVNYDVPADHHLSLVVDGKDSLYIDWNDLGASVDFSGGGIDLPLR